MINRILSLMGIVLGVLWLASCSATSNLDSAAPMASESPYSAGWSGHSKRSGDTSMAAPPSPEPRRHGLATGFGDTQRDEIGWGEFARASSRPSGTAMLYYNDEEGAKAMADHSGYRSSADGKVRSSDGSITLSLKSGFRTLKGYQAGGKEFIVGESGHNYAIHIKNNTSRRLEVVASVDGLDVMDGRNASYSKRGYILKPDGSLTIKGFRRSTSEVAAFEFGSVSDSYANLKHGDTRNVGVVGVAVFQEATPREVNRRFAADPFASPPN